MHFAKFCKLFPTFLSLVGLVKADRLPLLSQGVEEVCCEW